MKKVIVLAVSAVALRGSLFPACHMYSLPSNSSVVIVGDVKTVHADRVDIFATEDANGNAVCPFVVSGYDKGGRLICNTMFGSYLVATNKTPEVLLAGVSDQVVVRKDAVRDGLNIGDSHVRISAKKAGDGFLVKVEDLDSQRLMAEADAQVAALVSANGSAPGSAKWPQMDDGRQYRCSCEDFSVVSPAGGGNPSEAGILRLKGALYQRGSEVSIRFAFSRENGKDGCNTIAAGRVVCEVSGDEVKNSAVTYDPGKGAVDAVVSLPKRNEVKRRFSEEIEKMMRNTGEQFRDVRLNLTYGEVKMKLDMNMQML